MNKIRLLFIEDNRILRESIESMFKKRTDMHIVGNISSSENIQQTLSELKPDILLIDMIVANQNSLQIVKLIKEQFQEIKIIVMGLIPTQSNISEYIETGVAGFILKDADTARFVKTILKVNRGLWVLPPLLTGSLFSQLIKNVISGSTSSIIDKSTRMTKRELEIVELIADGFTNKEIAQKLNISTYTVKSHVHNILEKLALSTRIQIAKHVHLAELSKSISDNTSLLEE
jgi:DNA-binding NarL/FixJ family response regulator